MSKKIENQVEAILKEFGIDRAPVPVDKIALRMNLAIVPTDLGPGISGALIINAGNATIGVNQNESKVRRRFTIAHELGHFVLHKSAESESLFVDKPKTMTVMFRDDNATSGISKEREANAFAANLLMPASILHDELAKAQLDGSLDNEEIISHLAKKFDVSDLAMTYRLFNLNIIWK